MAIGLRFDLRSSLLPLGEMRRTVDRLREAETLAAGLGDQSRLARALSFESNCLHLLGEYDRAVELALLAQAIAHGVGDVRLEAGSNLYLGQAHLALGDYRQAIEILRANLTFVGTDPGRANPGVAGLPIASRVWLAWSLTHVGNFAEALAYGREAMELAEATERAGSLVLASIGLAFHYVWAGNVRAAQSVAERGLVICESSALPLLSGMLMVQSGYIYALSGQVEKALPIFANGRAWADSIGLIANHAVGLVFLAHAYRLSGRIDEALSTCDEALGLARRYKERGHEAMALRVSAEIFAHRRPLDAPTAEGRYREALSIAAELGMRPLVAHCRLGLGELYRRTGNREQALENLTTARTMYGEMGMRFWLEQAQADMSNLA
jgi:tetratricopeptide (TPR) repeat protein